MRELLEEAGFTPVKPIALEGGSLVVKVWLGCLAASAPDPETEPKPEDVAR